MTQADSAEGRRPLLALGFAVPIAPLTAGLGIILVISAVRTFRHRDR
jgi:hypothetical protein